jgi:hypothetical protein
LTFSKAVLSLNIATDSLSVLRVDIKYFHSLNLTSVLRLFWSYGGLIKTMQTGSVGETIYLCLQAVKSKRFLPFQALFADFPLKCCIEGPNLKIKSSGRT